MNFFFFSFFFLYNFVIAYDSEHPLTIYKGAEIDGFNIPVIKEVGTIIRATFISLVTNFIFGFI